MNKFNEIFLDLEQKILEKEYPPHTLLPSENQSRFMVFHGKQSEKRLIF